MSVEFGPQVLGKLAKTPIITRNSKARLTPLGGLLVAGYRVAETVLVSQIGPPHPASEVPTRCPPQPKRVVGICCSSRKSARRTWAGCHEVPLAGSRLPDEPERVNINETGSANLFVYQISTA